MLENIPNVLNVPSLRVPKNPRKKSYSINSEQKAILRTKEESVTVFGKDTY